MTDREKLIELLKVPIHPLVGADPAEVVADYLLDNGVTFSKDTDVPSKWISVEERLPDEGVWVLAYQHCGWMGVAQIEEDGWHWYTQDLVKLEDPICWMSLPQPPREE